MVRSGASGKPCLVSGREDPILRVRRFVPLALIGVKASPRGARTVSIRAMDTTTIASWNVNSLNVRLPHLEEWLKLRQPDIVGLQETKLEDPRFPDSVLAGLGYRS